MADRVIVVGAKRARQAVPVSEIKQMVGRGGRKHNGEVCHATVIVEEELSDAVRQGMDDSDSFIVKSSLTNPETLAFHLLPELCNQNVANLTTAALWFERSLAAHQGVKPDINAAFDLLVDVEAAEWDGLLLRPTGLGQVAARLYFNPGDIWAWSRNFDTIFEQELENDDGALAWALGTVPNTRMSGNFGEGNWEVVELCKNEIPTSLNRVDGTIVTITLWRYVLGGLPVGKMRNQALSLRGDSGRICQALIDLNDVMEWNRESFFKELVWRCRRGIPHDLVDLCRLPGISKGRAAFLVERGIKNRADIETDHRNVEDDIDELFRDTLRSIASGVC